MEQANYNRIASFRLAYYILVFAPVLFSILFAARAHSAQVTVAWDPVSAAAAGYKVYYGPSTGNYTNNVDAGNNTTSTLTNLSNTAYYLAATAYDSNQNESGFSQELIIYSMAASADTGGSITPTGSFFVGKGTDQTFNITPDANHSVTDVQVDGRSVGIATSYTFSNVEGNHTISATFASNVYVITAAADAGGAISPSGPVSVTTGASQAFTITPAPNNRVADVLVDGVSAGAVTSYTFSDVSANHTISARFAPNTYAISANAQANGSISPSGSVSVNSGGSQSFAITPNFNYKISNVVVDGVSRGPISSYTFSNVMENHTISATFALNTYTITASAQANGTISPSGSVVVNQGTTQTFSIIPNTGYRVADVLVDGQSVGAVTSYSFSSVTAGHSISASFTQADQPPVANAGPDQTVPESLQVTLNGSNSTDPENGTLSYLWTQTGGSLVFLSSETEANPTFNAPSVGTGGEALTFQLTVTDQAGLESYDSCIVNVTWVNEPPTANAGPVQTVNEGAAVMLEGSDSTDPDDGIASFEWQQIAGPTVTLVPLSASEMTFAAPDVGLTGTSLTFSLTVTDKGGLKSEDTCVVNVTWVDSPPNVDAGPDQTVYIGDNVVLDGSASNDPDDGILSYQWKQTNGTPVTLTKPAEALTSFTAPNIDASGATLSFTLTVKDNSGLQSTSTCNVYVKQQAGSDLTGSWSSLSYRRSTLYGYFTVKNTGNQRVGSFSVRFYLSSDGTTLGSLIEQKYLRYLNAAQSTRLSFKEYARGLSGMYVIAVVDAYDSVEESNEQNNMVSVRIP